mgnify:CR=1 FL=1
MRLDEQNQHPDAERHLVRRLDVERHRQDADRLGVVRHQGHQPDVVHLGAGLGGPFPG